MPSCPYTYCIRPEQSNPPAGLAPPHTYGVPRKCVAIATAVAPIDEAGVSCSQACRSNGIARTKERAAGKSGPGADSVGPAVLLLLRPRAGAGPAARAGRGDDGACLATARRGRV